MAVQGDKIKAIFRRYRPNDDMIATEELKKVLLIVGKGKFSEDEVGTIVTALDWKKDHRIQIGYFVDWIVEGGLEPRPAADLDPSLVPAEESPADAVRRLRTLMPGAMLICILGGRDFQCSDSEALVRAVAQQLASGLKGRAAFVTGGLAGVQRVFAESCGDGSQLWNLLPFGEASGYGTGTDVHAGANLQQRMEVTSLLGDIYLTVEGGPGVAKEAREASARGARVLPLMRTGGASSGMFDFPKEALERPPSATEQQWELLRRTDASVEDTAAAFAAIAVGLASKAQL
mmetsp:Transcript_9062/g.25307  ORF Transcript_9062/g.25307 Transcript_9062/m.25307 type:complete len:289 (-) Transcript_9062:171-1037(-)|eukprot:CAMPEP_0179080942 /NCGR_PEP_ID=MMETSP0796-20121207/36410_1 /TAXON_ID=73915 /ORGANISM="Pyrodinium bahamense, Strain pbaha01" /LENGTH=288 /DNA_ID=CAMNT_0020778309 /DNA_START=53 /DNA_END=919 /DNA_ORIENTATION=+